MMPPRHLSCSLGILIYFAAIVFAEKPANSTYRLTCRDGAFVASVDFDFSVGGRLIETRWDDVFDQLFTFYDHDDDAQLSAAEVARLPTAYALRQLLWGNFSLTANSSVTLEELDFDDSGRVTCDELAAYYRARGIGDLQVAQAQVPAARVLQAALVRQLDINADDQLEADELNDIYERLEPLDDNADELIGPGELSTDVSAYPGVTASVLVNLESPENLQTSHFAFSGGATSSHDAISMELTSASKASSAVWRTRKTGNVDWFVRSDPGRLPTQTDIAIKNSEAWFNRLDRDRDHFVDSSEVAGDDRRRFDSWKTLLDRDDDGRISTTETAKGLALQRTIAEAHWLITVLDFERGLFEYFDVNHDGGLSRNELRDVSARLSREGRLSDGRLNLAQLPVQILCIVANGHPREPLLQQARSNWFQAMDRNGDGTVSRSEFLGTAQTFAALDSDHDGALSAAECDPYRH